MTRNLIVPIVPRLSPSIIFDGNENVFRIGEGLFLTRDLVRPVTNSCVVKRPLPMGKTFWRNTLL